MFNLGSILKFIFLLNFIFSAVWIVNFFWCTPSEAAMDYRELFIYSTSALWSLTMVWFIDVMEAIRKK